MTVCDHFDYSPCIKMTDVQKNSANSKPRESKRHCKHNHGRRKSSIEELMSPQSHIYEESNGVDILKLDDRPATSSSSKKSVTMSPRPASRHPDSRPSTTRSAFEHIPGTRPASRRVSLLYHLSFIAAR